MLRLSLTYKDSVRHFEIPAVECTLGSSRDSDLVAPFPGISRRHASVSATGGGVKVRDLGSLNGLVSDGRKYAEIELQPGKTVRLGRALLKLEEISTSDAVLGLRLDRESGSSSKNLASRSDTGIEVPPDEPSPSLALHFVRDYERDGRRSGEVPHEGLLRRARIALGAQALILARSGALVASAGELPSDEVTLDDLLSRAAQATRAPELVATDQGALLIARSDSEARLCLMATFAPPKRRNAPETWQRDFFSYLADIVMVEELAETDRLQQGGEENALQLPPGMIVGSSAAMRGLLAQVRATVKSDLNVLLLGETGTGKELFAGLIHNSGPAADGPFVAINCAAIPSELLEAELFGVVARVATGVDPRPGLFVQAQGGTIFLDEIGEMSERLQTKLLRVLQEREVLPLGGSVTRKIQVRVIAASNRDLERLVGERCFREDLYYRLRGLQFRIPALRERCDDLPEMVATLAARFATKYKKDVRGFTRSALRILQQHSWPGNIRELQSEVERAVLLCKDGGYLGSDSFSGLQSERPRRYGQSEVQSRQAVDRGRVEAPPPEAGPTLRAQVDALERLVIAEALSLSRGNRSKAASMLGITRNGLSLKIRRLKI